MFKDFMNEEDDNITPSKIAKNFREFLMKY